jgi:hypothetical protein
MLSHIDFKRNQHSSTKGYGNFRDSFKAGKAPYEEAETKGTGKNKVSAGTGMIVRGVAMTAPSACRNVVILSVHK